MGLFPLPFSLSLLGVVCMMPGVGGVNSRLTALAASYSSDITIATFEDKMEPPRKVQRDASCPISLKIRPYCSHTCSETYNQLFLDEDRWLVFTNGYVLVVSDANDTDKAKVHCVRLPSCNPLVAMHEHRAGPVVNIYCAPRPGKEHAVTVRFLRLVLNGTWDSNERSFQSQVEPNGVSAVFFTGTEGKLFLAYTTDQGMSFCNILDISNSPPIRPDNCPWIARISNFDDFTLMIECTANSNSTTVVVSQMYSILSASFGQKAPVQNYKLGHLVFSDDKLYCATFEDNDIRVVNLTVGKNPPVYQITVSGSVHSVHFIVNDTSVQLVVLHSAGVNVLDVSEHQTESSSQESRTLGSGNIDIPSGGSPPPGMSVVNNTFVAFVADKYTLEICPLERDFAVKFFVSDLARYQLLVQPRKNSSNTPTNELSVRLTVGVAVSTACVLIILVVISLIVLTAYIVRKRLRRNPRELRLMNPEDNNDTVTHRLNLFLRRWMREGVAHLRSGYSRLSRLSGSVTSVDSVGNIHTDLSIASDLNVSDGQIEPPELPHPMQACNPHNQEFVLPNLHVTQPLPQDSAEERSTQVDTQSLSAQNHDVMAVEDGEPHDGQYIVSNNLPLPPHPLPEEERHSGDGMA